MRTTFALGDFSKKRVIFSALLPDPDAKMAMRFIIDAKKTDKQLSIH
jgi:hypothetical protein